MGFKDLYENLSIVVIVCENTDDLPVVYLNRRAHMLLSPSYSVDTLIDSTDYKKNIRSVLKLKNSSEYSTVIEAAMDLGVLDDYETEIIMHDGSTVVVNLVGAALTGKNKGMFAFYVLETGADKKLSLESQLVKIVNTVFLSDNVDYSINAILALAGEAAAVSRAYVFEEISPTMTRNTYEWCAEGVEPAIQNLQDLAKADYNYDVIVNSGMYIVSDVSKLPGNDREILETQGIAALAILSIYDGEKPVGYVGFDDCNQPRSWSHSDIDYLKSIASLLAMLIKRRKTEEDLRNTLSVLRIISDNAEEMIYANDIEDYTLMFVNNALAEAARKQRKGMVGEKCYSAIYNRKKPCDFCPMPDIQIEEGRDRSQTLTREFCHYVTKRTYMAKDNIIKWVDGRYVHVESAMDISKRVEYETQLKYYASTDTLTGIENREWGAVELETLLQRGSGGSLCFLDIDGLKHTNDTMGHAMGDQLLKATVEIIKDFINEKNTFCRWGGDEFLLWMPLNTEQVREIIVRIQREMDKLNGKKLRPYKLSFSYGIVAFDMRDTLDELVSQADELMYKNKMEKRSLIKKRRREDRP